jgi:hypothetical protein
MNVKELQKGSMVSINNFFLTKMESLVNRITKKDFMENGICKEHEVEHKNIYQKMKDG